MLLLTYIFSHLYSNKNELLYHENVYRQITPDVANCPNSLRAHQRLFRWPRHINLNYITHGIKALTAWAWPSVYKTTKRCITESIHGKLSKHKSPLRFTYVFTGQRAITDRVLLNHRLYGRGEGGLHIHKATNSFFCLVIIPRFYLDLSIARKVRRKLNENQPSLSLYIICCHRIWTQNALYFRINFL